MAQFIGDVDDFDTTDYVDNGNDTFSNVPSVDVESGVWSVINKRNIPKQVKMAIQRHDTNTLTRYFDQHSAEAIPEEDLIDLLTHAVVHRSAESVEKILDHLNIPLNVKSSFEKDLFRDLWPIVCRLGSRGSRDCVLYFLKEGAEKHKAEPFQLLQALRIASRMHIRVVTSEFFELALGKYQKRATDIDLVYPIISYRNFLQGANIDSDERILQNVMDVGTYEFLRNACKNPTTFRDILNRDRLNITSDTFLELFNLKRSGKTHSIQLTFSYNPNMF